MAEKKVLTTVVDIFLVPGSSRKMYHKTDYSSKKVYICGDYSSIKMFSYEEDAL